MAGAVAWFASDFRICKSNDVVYVGSTDELATLRDGTSLAGDCDLYYLNKKKSGGYFRPEAYFS
ncbi:hypothetical protein IPL68_08020 [Candidatus Saccharibacteria bacterium]|nr:MAG: hypothetical protein IPL68_08020 [Candidatus Saccharibacteria bacterium]